MNWCGHHVGFVLAVGRIQPMLEIFETGSILGVILVPLFTVSEYEHANICPSLSGVQGLIPHGYTLISN